MAIKLKTSILAYPSPKEIVPFWDAVFKQMRRFPDMNSISLLRTEHGFWVLLGTNGAFEPSNEIEVLFKEVHDEWREEMHNFSIDEFEAFVDEGALISRRCKAWYFDWVRRLFELSKIMRLRNSILGDRSIGIWKCLSEDDCDAEKHR